MVGTDSINPFSFLCIPGQLTICLYASLLFFCKAFMECNGSTGRVTGRFVSGNVLNLSHRVLSEGEVSLLSKGLKFSPTPTGLNKAQLKADFDIFKRRMRLRWFFRDTDSNNLDKNSLKFKCKSSWSPSNTDPLLESYLAQFEKEVLSVQAEGKYHSNLSSSELTALNNLKCDRNIVIKEADKGSAVVVWDRGITQKKLTGNQVIGKFTRRLRWTPRQNWVRPLTIGLMS